MMAVAALLTACSGKEESSATVHYKPMLDSVQVTALKDTLFIPMMRKAMDSLKVTNIFIEEATTDVGNIGYVISKCDDQAALTFNRRLTSLTKTQIQNCIFEQNADTLKQLHYTDAASLDIQPLKLFFSVWNIMYDYRIINNSSKNSIFAARYE